MSLPLFPQNSGIGSSGFNLNARLGSDRLVGVSSASVWARHLDRAADSGLRLPAVWQQFFDATVRYTLLCFWGADGCWKIVFVFCQPQGRLLAVCATLNICRGWFMLVVAVEA